MGKCLDCGLLKALSKVLWSDERGKDYGFCGDCIEGLGTAYEERTLEQLMGETR